MQQGNLTPNSQLASDIASSRGAYSSHNTVAVIEFNRNTVRGAPDWLVGNRMVVSQTMDQNISKASNAKGFGTVVERDPIEKRECLHAEMTGITHLLGEGWTLKQIKSKVRNVSASQQICKYCEMFLDDLEVTIQNRANKCDQHMTSSWANPFYTMALSGNRSYLDELKEQSEQRIPCYRSNRINYFWNDIKDEFGL